MNAASNLSEATRKRWVNVKFSAPFLWIRRVTSRRTTRDIGLDIVIGLMGAVFIAAIRFPKFNPLEELLGFFAMSWTAALCTRLRTPVLDDWRLRFAALQDRDPALHSFLRTRIDRCLGELFNALEQVLAGSGEPWKPKTRLDAANDLFDGFSNVHSYDATNTDPPYWPIAGINAFYARQAEAHKFPGGGKTRRILIYPEDALKSWSRKSGQDAKWSFCLTAGTLCPANQERP